MNEHKVKKIVAKYLNIHEVEVTDDTKIDASAFQGSIMFYRMFSELEEVGFTLDPGFSPLTYYDLINGPSANKVNYAKPNERENSHKSYNHQANINSGKQIGIDLQELSQLPPISEKLDPFYLKYFSGEEIEHSLKKTNPLETFAGLYALKEAIYKASDNKKYSSLEKINVTYLDNIPFVEGYHISISHSSSLAVAVALLDNPHFSSDKSTPKNAVIIQKNDSKIVRELRMFSYIFMILTILVFAMLFIMIIK